MMGQNRDALECAQERYCLYLTSHTYPPAIRASFALIESCIHNKEYEDAELYARTTWETITLSRDSHIPDNEREWFIARGAYFLARAMISLAQHGDIPPEENQIAGQEAIALARRALEIQTQLHGTESHYVANAMGLLADALDHFSNVDIDDVLRLYEQSIAITARVEGSSSVNVGADNKNLALAYHSRAERAHAANDLNRVIANLELALPYYREAARIFSALNLLEKANESARIVVAVEKNIRKFTIARAAAASVVTMGRR